MKHIATMHHDIILVYFIKDNHCYPITDEKLKVLATKANQGGVDKLWKYVGQMKWSRRHEQFVVINDMEEVVQLDVSNKIIVLPENEKILLLIDIFIVLTTLSSSYVSIIMAGLMGFWTIAITCTCQMTGMRLENRFVIIFMISSRQQILFGQIKV